MPSLALSELLGSAVYDRSGEVVGKVREVALVPQEDTNRISGLVVKTKFGDRLLNPKLISSINGGVRIGTLASEWSPYGGGEGMLLLERDLLDQQIIDVHGRKVVRVNDIDLHEEVGHEHVVLKLAAVDVGARGAIRRLLKGVVPAGGAAAHAGQDSATHDPLGVRRPDRGRSLPPHQAENFARPSGGAASCRYCRHCGRFGAG